MANKQNKIESEWLAKAIGGSDEAFSMLVECYLPKVYGLCLSLTGNKEDAEDCVQETFIKAWSGLSNFKAHSSFYTWLYRIAFNTCMDLRRAASRKISVSLDESSADGGVSLLDRIKDPSPMPDEAAIEKESGQIIIRAIESLPKSMQEILILRDIQSCSYQEIARLLEIAEGTVKSRLFRARQQLMNYLQSEELNLLAGRQSNIDQYRKGEVGNEDVL